MFMEKKFCFFVMFIGLWLLNNSFLNAEELSKNATAEDKRLIKIFIDKAMCSDVLKIEKKNAKALNNKHPAYDFCLVNRALEKQLTIPKMKDEEFFSQYLPSFVHLGDFSSENIKIIQQIKKDRGGDWGTKTSNRPVDWKDDPISLSDELAFHKAMNDLARLAACDDNRYALKKIVQLAAQFLKYGGAYINYGLLKRAEKFNIDKDKLPALLSRASTAYEGFEKIRFRRSFDEYKWGEHPQMKQLFTLCKALSLKQ